MLVLEDLNLDGLKIYQDDSLYRFTSDAVLLSRFATVKKGDVVADFCSGSGIVGINLFGLNKNLIQSVTLFEMQEELYSLSKKTIEYNNLQDKISAINTRIQDMGKAYAGKFSLITCNPPYMPLGAGFKDEKDFIAKCRCEVTLTLEELIPAISTALKFGGRVCLVHRADRLADVICLMRKYNIEPKRLQFVSGGDKEPYLMLIEGVKGGKSGIKILKNQVN
ncbi:MAG: SAM-dependent methyltransferase [Clostridiales bacterium]|nr:SAM-dependent methyltransferase [Clostridiales bacterium]